MSEREMSQQEMERQETGMTRRTFVKGLALGAAGADWLAAGAGAALMLAVSLVQRRGSVRERLAEKPLALRWAVFGALLLAVVVFGAYGVGFDANQFIYNQF